MSTASRKHLRKARERLRQAVDVTCIARGEAQWTHGYRVGSGKGDDPTLYDKEQAQWAACDRVEKKLERAITAYARAVRRLP